MTRTRPINLAIFRALALFAILLSGALAAPAQEPPRVPAQVSPQVIVEAAPGLEGVAARLRGIDPARLASAMRLVGLKAPGPPIRVILAPEGSAAAAAVPPWVSGYALGDQGLIVLLPGRVPSYPDSSLSDLLAHEVTHVLIARAAGGGDLPRWFHEGLAMIAGLSWGIEDRSRLTLALLVDRPISLGELDQRFAGGQGEVNRAYAVAGAFVRDLFDRYGRQVAARILQGVARGLPFDQAFQAATGTPLAEAASAFWDRQTFWYRWVPIVTSSVTLWMAVTLLALWAIQRRRARDAAQRRVWDQEEERLRLAAEARALVQVQAQNESGEWVN
jgi:hypothetical protein